MKPDPGRFLEVAAAHLLQKTAPAADSGYERGSLAIMAGMLGSVRLELERAAARRVEENRELRRIFADATRVVADAGLRDRLEAARASEQSSLLVSALERENDALRALLIELHAHVEELDSPGAREIERVIWSELVASTERRQLGPR